MGLLGLLLLLLLPPQCLLVKGLAFGWAMKIEQVRVARRELVRWGEMGQRRAVRLMLAE